MNINVIKVGGKIVEEPDTLHNLLESFSKIDGAKALVHGGGRSATRIATLLGIESKMVDGRRITDAETLKVVTMVYGGLVNKNIVASLQQMGINALGLTGADMGVIKSEKRPVKDVDYGFVGDVKSVDGERLASLVKDGVTPVMAPLSFSSEYGLLNTNADTIAAETAKSLVPYYDVTLTFCFEKKGVLMNEADDDSVIPVITRELYAKYKADGIITGGMIPKLDNAFDAIDSGVKRVVITRADMLDAGSVIVDS
ncbi:MAG: acetylglutamate kinase [Paludibacteraceae bacterium]|nr:acetylglutamate kinase [Paludibacteraceae bacterium]MDY6373146.1 acetylglutamate kinase [Bacteroidales bacterium]